MKFTPTPLAGATVIDIEKHQDERGFFARAFCAKELEEIGLNPAVAQCNVCFNPHKGTVRGMHYQTPPATETKLIRCTRGAMYDVIIDMRPESPTYLQHFGVELSAENHRALFVPAMFAHGYQTLTDDTEMMYIVSEFYTPGCEQGVRYDDPVIGIEWPLEIRLMSDKDRGWGLLSQHKARIATG